MKARPEGGGECGRAGGVGGGHVWGCGCLVESLGAEMRGRAQWEAEGAERGARVRLVVWATGVFAGCRLPWGCLEGRFLGSAGVSLAVQVSGNR